MTVQTLSEDDTKTVWSMDNAHQSGVKSAEFIDKKTLMTCSADECSIWSLSKQQPIAILDNPSPDKTLRSVSYHQTKSMKLVLCLTETQVSIYNLTEGIRGVKECDSRVFLSIASRKHIDEIMACSLATEGKGK